MPVREHRMTPLHACLFTDDGYAPYAAATVRSVSHTYTGDADLVLHIVHTGLSPKHQDAIRGAVDKSRISLQFDLFDEAKLYSFPKSKYPQIEYLKIFLPETLPNTGRLLFLDCDIVVRTSIDQLYNLDMQGKPVAAALDYAFFAPPTAYFESIGVRPGDLYCNFGIVLFDTELYMERRCRERMEAWAAKNSEVIESSQCCFNTALEGDIALLPLSWNSQIRFITNVAHNAKRFRNAIVYKDEWRQAATSPDIVHFVTNRKPWRREYYLPYANEFRRHLLATDYAESALEPMTIRKYFHLARETVDYAKKCVGAVIVKPFRDVFDSSRP